MSKHVGPAASSQLEKALIAAASAFLEAYHSLSSSPESTAHTGHPAQPPAASPGQTLVPQPVRFPARLESSAPLRDAINEFLISKAQAGRSPRYLEDLRFRLERFSAGRRLTPLSEISWKDVQEWLTRETAWNPKSQRQAVQAVQTLARWGIRRRYCSEDPTAALELPRASSPPPKIHTPQEVQQVLHKALELDPLVARHLAIRYFAGLRSAEALRLGTEDVRNGRIEVSAAKAKTRSRRLVRIRPNLAAWLEATPAEYIQDDRRTRQFIAAARLAWPQNVCRHSFVSYALALEENAARLALEAGHSEAMLFGIYRETVTPEAAAEFWKIMPPQNRTGPRDMNPRAG